MEPDAQTTVDLKGSEATTVHLKGFASGFDYHDSLTLALLSMLKLNKITDIVWDGDLLAPGSFTKMIPVIMEIYPEIQFTAFAFETDKISRLESWEHFNDKIQWIWCPDMGGDGWKKLGIHALKVTNSKTVYALGGGQTVSAEHATCEEGGLEVEFNDFPWSRLNNGKEEAGHLSRISGSKNLKHIAPVHRLDSSRNQEESLAVLELVTKLWFTVC